MGWLIGWRSKAEVVEHVKAQLGERFVRGQVVGNVFWVVERGWTGEGQPPGKPGIVCFLLDGGRGGGPGAPRWGYKDMSEGMHPFYYSCPLSYLDLAPEASAEWRAGVRAYHAARAARTAVSRGAKPGDLVRLQEGCKPAVVTVLEKRGRTLVGEAGGVRYRVPAKLVAAIVPKAA